MKINHMKIDFEETNSISLWLTCYNEKDVDNLIEWLHLAKNIVNEWNRIKSKDKD